MQTQKISSPINLYIRVKNRFIAFHRYKDAPNNVSFLKSFHRHEFCVKTILKVDHSNRDIEFFTIQEKIQRFLDKAYKGKKFEKSCEMIAREVLKKFNAYVVTVSEDDENEGIATNELIK